MLNSMDSLFPNTLKFEALACSIILLKPNTPTNQGTVAICKIMTHPNQQLQPGPIHWEDHRTK